jgi:hypothetical protein
MNANRSSLQQTKRPAILEHQSNFLLSTSAISSSSHDLEFQKKSSVSAGLLVYYLDWIRCEIVSCEADDMKEGGGLLCSVESKHPTVKLVVNIKLFFIAQDNQLV